MDQIKFDVEHFRSKTQSILSNAEEGHAVLLTFVEGVAKELPFSSYINAMLGDVTFLKDPNSVSEIQNHHLRAIDLDPLNPDPYLSLAKLLDICGEHQEVLKLLRKSIAARQSIDAYVSLVETLICLGENQQAKLILDEAVAFHASQESKLLGVARLLEERPLSDDRSKD